MTIRERLPDRRPHEVVSFEHGGVRYYAGVGRYPDGRLGELFLNSAKGGTAADTAARDGAIAVSIALQHGATADTIRHALTRNSDGSASGPVGKILDLLSQGRR